MIIDQWGFMLEKVFDFIEKSGMFKSCLALFILSAVILFWPNLLISIGMEKNFINEYKNIIVLILGFSFLMVLFSIIHESYKKYINYRNTDKQVALRYLKKSLTRDQQEFIDKIFFDAEKNKYKQFGRIDELEERGLELERHKIVEKGDKIDIDLRKNESTYSYNLLSYSLEFLNKNRKQ